MTAQQLDLPSYADVEPMDQELAEAEAEIEAEIDRINAGLAFPSFAAESHQTLPRFYNWKDRLPRGKVVLITGWRECGKGLVGWNLTGALTNGWLLPGETGDPDRIAAGLSPKEPASVIGIWDEDDRNEDNSPRADAACAERSRVYDMSEMPGGTPFELSAAKGDMGDIPELLGFIRQLRTAGRNPRMVIMDPLDNLVMTGSHVSKQGATRLIRRLEFVARRTGVTIVIFHHLVEDGKRGKVGGSSKLVDVPRWVYRIERDEEAPELWTLKKFKGNVGNPDPVRYRVIKDGDRSRIEWVPAEAVQAEERAWRRPELTVVPEPAPDVPGLVRDASGYGMVPKPRPVPQVTEYQGLILAELKRSGPSGAQEIAEATGIAVGSVRVMLHRMEKRGQVVKAARGVYEIAGAGLRIA